MDDPSACPYLYTDGLLDELPFFPQARPSRMIRLQYKSSYLSTHLSSPLTWEPVTGGVSIQVSFRLARPSKITQVTGMESIYWIPNWNIQTFTAKVLFFLAINTSNVQEMLMSSCGFKSLSFTLCSSSIPSSISSSVSSVKPLMKRPRSMSYDLDFVTLKSIFSSVTSTSNLASRRKAEVISFRSPKKAPIRFSTFVNQGNVNSPASMTKNTPPGDRMDSTPLKIFTASTKWWGVATHIALSKHRSMTTHSSRNSSADFCTGNTPSFFLASSCIAALGSTHQTGVFSSDLLKSRSAKKPVPLPMSITVWWGWTLKYFNKTLAWASLASL